jgi:hypothetical protein
MSAWDAPNIIGVAGIVLGLPGMYVALSREGRTRRAEETEEAQERSDKLLNEIKENRKTVDDRLKELEVKSADFMPRREIEAKIEHEKANRLASDQQILRTQEAHGVQISEIKVCLGKLEERHVGLAEGMIEIKDLVKELRSDMRIGFKEMKGVAI